MGVSIIIPVHNSERFLAASVRSVQRQTGGPGWELIVVDDGSTDATAARAHQLARSDGRVRVLQRAHGGPSAARNSGMAAADPSSEYVVFLDADDVWEGDALATLRAALETDPAAVAAHGLARFIDEGGQAFPGQEGPICRDPVRERTTFALLTGMNCIPTPGLVLIRRSALVAAGPFDTTLATCEDWDFWLRLSSLGDLVYVDRVVLGYRRHGGNLSGDPRLLTEGRQRLLQKWDILA